MKIYYVEEVLRFIEGLNIQYGTRLKRVRELFVDYGFTVGPKYVKKIFNNIWELRAGNVRLFLCIKDRTVFGVHAIYKKTQKLNSKDIKLAIKRCKKI